MSEMKDMILESATRIFEDHCTKEKIDELEKGVWDQKLWGVLGEYGLTSIGVSEDLGGVGGDYEDALGILRLVGQFSVPLPISETITVNRLLSKINIEPSTEPHTISLNNENDCKVKLDGSSHVVSAKLENVPWARYCTKVLTIGKLDDKDVLVLLPISEAKIDKNNNLAGEPVDDLVFEQVLVDNQEIFEVDKDKIMQEALYFGALAKSMMMSGALKKVLDLSVQYVQEREQFGRPLHRLQAIQQMIAVLAGETAAAIAITNNATHGFNQGKSDVESLVAYAKIKVNESANSVTDISHQIHGAIGTTYEHQLHHFTRRLWAWRDENGTETDWSIRIANAYMESEHENLWDMITENAEVVINQ